MCHIYGVRLSKSVQTVANEQLNCIQETEVDTHGSPEKLIQSFCCKSQNLEAG